MQDIQLQLNNDVRLLSVYVSPYTQPAIKVMTASKIQQIRMFSLYNIQQILKNV